MQGRRSALIVIVAEADPVVGRLRLTLDPVARLGVPAHVSVLFPFLPAHEIDDGVTARVANLFEIVPAFQHSFVRTDRFGDDVLWLASDAQENFRSLTALVWAAFPAHPPYGGKFADVVPHLTVADRASAEDMRAAEIEVRARLPISAVTDAVTLMAETRSGRWETITSFPLAGSTSE